MTLDYLKIEPIENFDYSTNEFHQIDYIPTNINNAFDACDCIVNYSYIVNRLKKEDTDENSDEYQIGEAFSKKDDFENKERTQTRDVIINEDSEVVKASEIVYISLLLKIKYRFIFQYNEYVKKFNENIINNHLDEDMILMGEKYRNTISSDTLLLLKCLNFSDLSIDEMIALSRDRESFLHKLYELSYRYDVDNFLTLIYKYSILLMEIDYKSLFLDLQFTPESLMNPFNIFNANANQILHRINELIRYNYPNERNKILAFSMVQYNVMSEPIFKRKLSSVYNALYKAKLIQDINDITKVCVAGMTCNSKHYVSINGMDDDKRLEGILNKNTEVELVQSNRDIRYYVTTNSFITYGQFLDWARNYKISRILVDDKNRMFTCAERKVMTKMTKYDRNARIICSLEPCPICRRAISYLSKHENKQLQLRYIKGNIYRKKLKKDEQYKTWARYVMNNENMEERPKEFKNNLTSSMYKNGFIQINSSITLKPETEININPAWHIENSNYTLVTGKDSTHNRISGMSFLLNEIKQINNVQHDMINIIYYKEENLLVLKLIPES